MGSFSHINGVENYNFSIPVFSSGYFHVFNKTIDGRQLFKGNELSNKFVSLSKYYRSKEATVGFSKISLLDEHGKNALLKQTKSPMSFGINILAYCLMPNHFHFLIKEREEGFTSTFVSRLLNSFTKYFNTKNERLGPLFLKPTKIKPIYTEEQFLHLVRYINLNPYTAGVVDNLQDLNKYPYSSYNEYGSFKRNKLTQGKDLISVFGNVENLGNFILERGEYQKELEDSK